MLNADGIPFLYLFVCHRIFQAFKKYVNKFLESTMAAPIFERHGFQLGEEEVCLLMQLIFCSISIFYAAFMTASHCHYMT